MEITSTPYNKHTFPDVLTQQIKPPTISFLFAHALTYKHCDRSLASMFFPCRIHIELHVSKIRRLQSAGGGMAPAGLCHQTLELARDDNSWDEKKVFTPNSGHALVFFSSGLRSTSYWGKIGIRKD